MSLATLPPSLMRVFEPTAEDVRARAARGAEIVARDDLLLVSRPLDDQWASHVHWARWDDGSAEARIDDVLTFFRERGRPFVWSVGASSTPADLGQRLERRGFSIEVDAALLVATLPIRGLRIDRALRIDEVRDEEDAATAVQLEHSDWPQPHVREAAMDLAARVRAGIVFAALATRDGKPVATARWRIHRDLGVVYLSGAFTHPAERRRGAYSTLVSYRTEHGARLGCVYAAITADRRTSAPILANRGFVEIGRERIYALPRSRRQPPHGR